MNESKYKKCEGNEEQPNELVKREFDSYNNETILSEGNSISIQGTSDSTSDFSVPLLNDDYNQEHKDSDSAYNECRNREIIKYEQDYLNDEQVPSKIKQEVEDQDDSIDTLHKEEIEFVGVQENLNIIHDCYPNNEKIWNNDEGAFTSTKSRAEYMREYRRRVKLKKQSNQLNALLAKTNSDGTSNKSHAEYMREYRRRVKLKKESNQLYALLAKDHTDATSTKSRAEYMKEYRRRVKLKKQSDQVNAMLTKDDSMENMNDFDHYMKCKRNEEQSYASEKSELGSYNNETIVSEGNSISTQGTSGDTSDFSVPLSNDNYSQEHKDSKTADNECSGNREILKYEQNYLGDEQLPSKIKQEVEDQEDSINTLYREEMEFVDVKEPKNIIDHCNPDKEKIWNNDEGALNFHFVKMERSEDFNSTTECTKIKIKDASELLSIQMEPSPPKCDIPTILDSIHTKRKNHKCYLCDFSSSRKGHLQTHIKSVHLNLRNHKCHLCDYSSSHKQVLQRHIKSIHLKIKNLKCHLCDYCSSQKGALQKHIKSDHLDPRNHKCHVCDYSSTKKRHLQMHIKSVHLKLKNHKCHVCEYSSPIKKVLQSHIESIHLKLKNHKCHLCDYSSSQKGVLQRHIKSIHLKLKNFKCNLCDYSSSLNGALQRHIKSVHLKPKEHKCHLCDYTSSHKGDLQKHIKSFHLKLKNNKCDLCDYSSSLRGHLQTHMNSAHL